MLVSGISRLRQAANRYAQPEGDRNMRSFLDINRQKISFAFKALSLTFTGIVLVIFIIRGILKNEYPDFLLFASVLVGASTIFPIFIIGLAYMEWLSKRRIRIKVFGQKPFDQLDKIGFTSSFINEKSKWNFTEETKGTHINNYRIQCDVRKESYDSIQFKIFIKYKALEKEVFNSLVAKFEAKEIYFDYNGLVKKYNLKKVSNLTLEQLKSDLTMLVQTARQEEFEPLEN